jgi:hypothetical protein
MSPEAKEGAKDRISSRGLMLKFGPRGNQALIKRYTRKERDAGNQKGSGLSKRRL